MEIKVKISFIIHSPHRFKLFVCNNLYSRLFIHQANRIHWLTFLFLSWYFSLNITQNGNLFYFQGLFVVCASEYDLEMRFIAFVFDHFLCLLILYIGHLLFQTVKPKSFFIECLKSSLCLSFDHYLTIKYLIERRRFSVWNVNILISMAF